MVHGRFRYMQDGRGMTSRLGLAWSYLIKCGRCTSSLQPHIPQCLSESGSGARVTCRASPEKSFMSMSRPHFCSSSEGDPPDTKQGIYPYHRTYALHQIMRTWSCVQSSYVCLRQFPRTSRRFSTRHHERVEVRCGSSGHVAIE